MRDLDKQEPIPPSSPIRGDEVRIPISTTMPIRPAIDTIYNAQQARASASTRIVVALGTRSASQWYAR